MRGNGGKRWNRFRGSVCSSAAGPKRKLGRSDDVPAGCQLPSSLLGSSVWSPASRRHCDANRRRASPRRSGEMTMSLVASESSSIDGGCRTTQTVCVTFCCCQPDATLETWTHQISDRATVLTLLLSQVSATFRFFDLKLSEFISHKENNM